MSIEDKGKKLMAEIIADLKAIRAKIASEFAKHPATDNAVVKLDSAVNNLAAHPAAPVTTDAKPAA